MANIIDFSMYVELPKEKDSQNIPDDNHPEELGVAIQILIQQLRKAPLQRIS